MFIKTPIASTSNGYRDLYVATLEVILITPSGRLTVLSTRPAAAFPATSINDVSNITSSITIPSVYSLNCDVWNSFLSPFLAFVLVV